MKNTGIAFYSLIFLGLSLFAFNLVFTSMTDRSIFQIHLPKELVNKPADGQIPQSQAGRCSDTGSIDRLGEASDPALRRLAEYQNVCNSLVTKTVTISVEVPLDKAMAEESAHRMADRLKEFSSFGVSPLVMVEPTKNGTFIGFNAIQAGNLDPAVRKFFSTLKSDGVTDPMMGTWVPFPEANLPYWNHVNFVPGDFSAAVNEYLGVMKSQFPGANGSILLNSATYEHENFEWTDGEYVSLVAYVSGIKPGLVDSFGIEGFPWMPPAQSGRFGVFDAREYLNSRLAIEAADKIGVRSLWFNTGTYSRKYTLDKGKTVFIDPGKRKDVLNGIISELETAEKKGYSVSINLLAEDRSNLAEATDWSYWSDPNDLSDMNRAVFVDFSVKMNELGIPFSLNDESW